MSAMVFDIGASLESSIRRQRRQETYPMVAVLFVNVVFESLEVLCQRLEASERMLRYYSLRRGAEQQC